MLKAPQWLIQEKLTNSWKSITVYWKYSIFILNIFVIGSFSVRSLIAAYLRKCRERRVSATGSKAGENREKICFRRDLHMGGEECIPKVSESRKVEISQHFLRAGFATLMSWWEDVFRTSGPVQAPLTKRAEDEVKFHAAFCAMWKVRTRAMLPAIRA